MSVPTPSALSLANQCLGAADTVICLHSSTGSQAQWRPLVQALTPQWQVLTLDLYGHGRSPAWPAGAPNTLDVDAGVVQHLLQGLDDGSGQPQSVHLVGHSYGAAVALRVAMRFPQRVKSLTLYEPVVFGLLPTGSPARHEVEDIARSVAGLVKANALAEAARVFVGYWGGPQAWLQMNPTQQATVIHRISTVPRHFEALFAARWRQRHFDRFARLQMPVLLMQGSETRQSAAGVMQQLLQALPQAQHCVVEGAAHLGPITHSAPVRQVMQLHLDSGTAPARIVPGCAIPPVDAIRPPQQLADSRLQQLAQPDTAAADAAAVPAAA